MKYQNLHNEIFSDTNCLTKKQIELLKQNKLSEKEIYNIEKHLVDCPFCSEAVEGYLANSVNSSVNELDALIDNKTALLKKKNSIKILLLAASVAILLSISWWSIKDVSIKNKTLSTNQKELNQYEIPKKLEGKTEFSHTNNEKSKSSSTIVIKNNTQKPEKSEIEISKSNTSNESDNNLLPETEDKKIFSTNDNNFDDESVEFNLNEELLSEEDEQINMAQTPTPQSSRHNSISKEYKSESANYDPVYLKNSSAYKQQTIYINGYKIYDYSAEYDQKEKAKKLTESLSVPVTMENKNDNTPAFDSTIIDKNTYIEMLENALSDLQNKNYQQAISKLSIIENKKPHDINALFYKGIAFEESGNYIKALAYFNKILKEKTDIFKEEAQFHKAKNLIRLGENKKAKKILQEIIKENSYYAKQAQQLLNTLKNE
jgi:hypothetical protein